MSIVRFDTATKQFSEDSFGVKDVSFSVTPGEFMFVTGQSGSGKTTLLRLLLKEYTTTSGEVYFHETALSSIKNRKIHLHRRRIGMVFQDYKLIPEMNIWENIALPLSLTGKSNDEIERRVTDLLNLIKIPEKAMLFPSQLSGGEAQRVGIARALAIGPELIIADEPTGNLDPETAQSIARLLKKINELGTTVIIATHDQNILSSSPGTRTLVLEKGKLMADADTESLAKKKYVATKKVDEQHAKEVKKTEEVEEKKMEAQSEKKPVEVVKDRKVAEELNTAEKQESSKNQKVSWWKKMFAKSKPDQDENKSEGENEKQDEKTKDAINKPVEKAGKSEKVTHKTTDTGNKKESKSTNLTKRNTQIL